MNETSNANEPFLAVEDLTVRFPTPDGVVQAVTDLSYDVRLGRTLGIVGESGSGKSVSSMAIMGLHDTRRAKISGSIRVQGTDLVGVDDERMRKIRGNVVSMIFQDPLSSLHPFYTIGKQISEAYLAHHHASKSEARKRAVEMLDRVGIPQAARRIDDYPHQFSGGMRQRAMIAMALVNDPQLLIADEPTTALDVTVQAQILDLLQDLQREFGSAIIIITHDLGVVAELSDDILVMYAGRVVEYGSAASIFAHPGHPYTWGLLTSAPHLTGEPEQRLTPIKGMPPSLVNLPTGCPFHPRCPYPSRLPDERCAEQLPDLRPGGRGAGHLVRCHLPNPEEIFVDEIQPRIG